MADKGTPAPLLVTLVTLTVVSGLADAALPLLVAAVVVVAVTGSAFGLSQRRGATMVA
jgi:hypothetical protein